MHHGGDGGKTFILVGGANNPQYIISRLQNVRTVNNVHYTVYSVRYIKAANSTADLTFNTMHRLSADAMQTPF